MLLAVPADPTDSISSKPELSAMILSFLSSELEKRAKGATPEKVGVRDDVVVTEGEEEYGDVSE